MNFGLFLLLIGGLVIVLVLTLFWHPQRSRSKASARAGRHLTGPIFRDDERYWYAGVFYSNSDDPDLFVPKRFGLGWTLNFGHPQARLVVIGILVLLLLPVVVAILVAIYPGLFPSYGCHPSGCHPFP